MWNHMPLSFGTNNLRGEEMWLLNIESVEFVLKMWKFMEFGPVVASRHSGCCLFALLVGFWMRVDINHLSFMASNTIIKASLPSP